MIITTIEELRLHSPAHALDSIDGIMGFIDNSEHDFLEEKLGTPLYERLCKYYEDSQSESSEEEESKVYQTLLTIAQRCVAFDALGRAIGMQVVSVNNAGVNQMIADDYPAPDKNGKTIEMYRQTCNQEAHAALNRLLRQLELWCNTDDEDKDREEIVELWAKSAYYYLSTSLLIPSCEILQRYLNIYDSREKFIQLLPDLQFIQEEQITPSVGEALMTALKTFAVKGELPEGVEEALFNTVLHRLRKVMVALLAGRTSVLKYSKEQKVQFHDDGVRMFETAINYLRFHQAEFPEELVKDAPWYVKEEPTPTPPPTPQGNTPCSGGFVKEHSSGAALWTPPLL